MVEQSSGTYVINKEYDIVSYNQTAIDLYPQLKKGEKCYKCLMGLDEPCPPCPVNNNVKGPKTYFDPIRKIYETVDAVPMISPDGEEQYALVFSTVGERERFSRQLPNTEDEFNSLYEQEYYDKLTGGLSLRGFIRETERILSQSSDDEEFAILYFNIKNFKAINDIFGFEAGDTLLCQSYIAIEKTNTCVKTLSRIDGDHFAALVDGKTLNYEYISENVTNTWSYNGKTIRIHSQCGIYHIEDKTIPVTGMIDRARLAQKNVTDEYIQPYVIFDERMREEYVDRAQVLADYEVGLQKEEFKVYYQPIIDVSTGKIASAEALVRWNHPEKGLISPGVFVPVLEKSGFITKVDHYVAEHVYRKMHERSDLAKPIVPVSLNLSWMDLYDKSMRAFITKTVENDNLKEGFFRFEATETALNSMEEMCSEFLNYLREKGGVILLDDFGSGYSSFSMIRKYEFDILKIDREFISGIESSVKTRNIICAIIAMCHQMNISVVAEGVETITQYEFLQLNGCDFIQGFYIAKPMAEEEFYEYVDREFDKGIINEKYFDRFLKDSEIDNTGNAEDDAAQWEKDLHDIILDNSNRFIQVCDPETMEMYYANEATRSISGNKGNDYRGQKCYKYMRGENEMCPHCPLRLMGDKTERQLEVYDGEHTFALTAKYINWRGKRLFLEMGMDITKMMVSSTEYDSQIKSIMHSATQQQGIFHLNLSENRRISSSGNAQNARELKNIESVDMLIRQIALFVPKQEDQEKLLALFSRESMLKAFDEGHKEINAEMMLYYDDYSIKWSRITAFLIENPTTKDIESIIQGVDISKEKEEEHLKKISKEELRRAVEKYHQADKDRRTDFLTGLNNRLELFEQLKRDIEFSDHRIKAMYMLDVDNFKAFNDKYGHIAGDRVLQKISKELYDYGEKNNVTFFRYGGEEILGIYKGEDKEPKIIAEEIINKVRDIKIKRDDGYGSIVTTSIGYTTDNSRYEKMINKADQAMYLAKSKGKDCVICFEEEKL